jgi:hypothetical protein
MKMHVCAALLFACHLEGHALAAETCRIILDTHQFRLGPDMVVDSTDGTLRLAHSVLLTDETGATDFHQTEALSERVWARKDWLLMDSAAIREPMLFIYGDPKHVQINDHKVQRPGRLRSTGWSRLKLTDQLHQGLNSILMKDGGQVLFEPRPGRYLGSSDKTTNAGENWGRGLGSGNGQSGEYLVRLRLKKYAASSWALSEAIDLWSTTPGEIAAPFRCVRIHSLASLRQDLPKETNLYVALRTGSSPTPDDNQWTPWRAISEDYRPDEAEARNRWAQLKIDLFTNQSQSAPRVPGQIEFVYERESVLVSSTDMLTIVHRQPLSPAITSVPFGYQKPSSRVKLLRERYQLDKVVAPGKTEMEQLMLLRHWVRNQWHTAWGSHPAAWMPPWDALMILECKDQPDCLTMCTHYATVFTQCCLALGWNARHCVLDHHCVSEVFVNQHNKWVMMDAGNSKDRADLGLHFQRNGVPLSALELHVAYHTGKTEDIMVCFTPARLAEQIASLCRPAALAAKQPPRPDVTPLAELAKYPVCQLANYRRYAFPGRNNYLDSLYPGELYQGWSEYFYDGYWWVGDSPDDPQLSPEYSRHLTPSRPQDIDWSLNWTRPHLARTAIAGELQVDLETFTPNLARLERWTPAPDKPDHGTWQPIAPGFVWKLNPGTNILRVRSVNRFERPGIESCVQAEWKPG